MTKKQQNAKCINGYVNHKWDIIEQKYIDNFWVDLKCSRNCGWFKRDPQGARRLYQKQLKGESND